MNTSDKKIVLTVPVVKGEIKIEIVEGGKVIHTDNRKNLVRTVDYIKQYRATGKYPAVEPVKAKAVVVEKPKVAASATGAKTEVKAVVAGTGKKGAETAKKAVAPVKKAAPAKKGAVVKSLVPTGMNKTALPSSVRNAVKK